MDEVLDFLPEICQYISVMSSSTNEETSTSGDDQSDKNNVISFIQALVKWAEQRELHKVASNLLSRMTVHISTVYVKLDSYGYWYYYRYFKVFVLEQHLREEMH